MNTSASAFGAIRAILRRMDADPADYDVDAIAAGIDRKHGDLIAAEYGRRDNVQDWALSIAHDREFIAIASRHYRQR